MSAVADQAASASGRRPKTGARSKERRHERRAQGARARARENDVCPDERQRDEATLRGRDAELRERRLKKPGHHHHMEARNREDMERPRVRELPFPLAREIAAPPQQDRAVEVCKLRAPRQPRADAARKRVPERRPARARTAGPGHAGRPSARRDPQHPPPIAPRHLLCPREIAFHPPRLARLRQPSVRSGRQDDPERQGADARREGDASAARLRPVVPRRRILHGKAQGRTRAKEARVPVEHRLQLRFRAERKEGTDGEKRRPADVPDAPAAGGKAARQKEEGPPSPQPRTAARRKREARRLARDEQPRRPRKAQRRPLLFQERHRQLQ